MEWAKARPSPRFDLAGSYVLPCSIDELPDARAAISLEGRNENGYPPLMTSIADRYGVLASQVTTAQGASGANFLVFAALLEPGDDVLVERPAYDPLLSAPRLLGARVVRFDRDHAGGFALDPDRVRQAITPRTRLVVLTSPHNPTGVVVDDTALDEVGRIAAAQGAYVLVDEVYLDASVAADEVRLKADATAEVRRKPDATAEVRRKSDATAEVRRKPDATAEVRRKPDATGDAGAASVLSGFSRTQTAAGRGEVFLTTSSLTKSYGLAGLRCGWILSSPALAERLRRARDVIDGSGSIVAERLATLAFSQLDRLIARSGALLAVNGPLVRSFLHARPELEAAEPRGGTVVFPRLRNVADSSRFAERLLTERETAIVPGRFFEAPAHFRVGFGGATDVLRGGLEALDAALDGREW
jgi:aspartate/methionine/tyrosine aminotransferase